MRSSSKEENIIADDQHQHGKASYQIEEINITYMGKREEIAGMQSSSTEKNIIADSQDQRAEASYQDHGIKYDKAEASVALVPKGFTVERSLSSIPALFKFMKSTKEPSYGLDVLTTLSTRELQQKGTDLIKLIKYLSKLYKFIVELYPNVNNEVIVRQIVLHFDSEVLTDVKAFLDESTIVHRLSSNFNVATRSDDENSEFPSVGQETQNVYFYKTLKNGKKPLSQFSIPLPPTEEVDIEGKQQPENISRYTSIIPVYLRRANNKEDDTAIKVVEDEAQNIPLTSNNQIEDEEEDKKEDTTAKLVVDDERSEADIDHDTPAKWTEDSDSFAHSDSEESEDLYLRSTTETTPDNSLENVTLDQTPPSYLGDSIRQCFFEWLRRQDGVTSYYHTGNEITIHVRSGAALTSTIDTILKTRFPQLRHTYRILFSDPGVCVPLANPDGACRPERGEPVQTPSIKKICPGKEISCSFVVSDETIERCATFSGKICSYGLTPGHMVPSETTQPIHINFESQAIGILILLIKTVDVPIRGTQETRTTTSDMLFFLPNDQDSVNNTFYGDPFKGASKETYTIVLHRDPVKENDEVMVILRNDDVKFGRIKHKDFNNEVSVDNDNSVLNTLYIVDENDQALTTDGDSGALVILRPNPGDRSLKAIGMVTHLHCRRKPEFVGKNYTKLNAENSTSLGTIAIRLYDVLVAIQQAILRDPPEFRKIDLGPLPDWIEFRGPQVTRQQLDSGFESHRSLEDPETR